MGSIQPGQHFFFNVKITHYKHALYTQPGECMREQYFLKIIGVGGLPLSLPDRDGA
jgi:hypothetical protein